MILLLVDIMFSSNVNIGFLTGQVAQHLVYLLVAVVIAVGVTLPVVTDIIEQQHFNGTIGTLMDLVPLFVALVIILAVVGVMF